MNRAERRKLGLTGKKGFKPYPNIAGVSPKTVFNNHATERRKKFYADCRRKGMSRFEMEGAWKRQEGTMRNV